jgi:ubiquinone/menaquinone biosynthesis C-methylase UbiE
MTGIIQAFNLIADSYDEWYEHPQGKQVFHAELRAVSKMLPESGIGLELGSGTGIFAKHLSTEERIIVCLDPSVEMVAKAKTRETYSVLGIGDYLPFRKKLLHFLYMVTVLEFLKSPKVILEEIKKTVIQDATLVILFINVRSPWGAFYREIGLKGDPVFRFAKLYSLSQVDELLEGAGYIITSKVGTLTTGPMEQDVGDDLVEPDDHSGVIIVQAKSS